MSDGRIDLNRCDGVVAFDRRAKCLRIVDGADAVLKDSAGRVLDAHVYLAHRWNLAEAVAVLGFDPDNRERWHRGKYTVEVSEEASERLAR